MDKSCRGSEVMNFMAGIVLGGIVGAGAALLFAPRSGEETRKMLKKRAQDMKREVEDFKNKVQPKIEEVKREVVAKLEKR